MGQPLTEDPASPEGCVVPTHRARNRSLDPHLRQIRTRHRVSLGFGRDVESAPVAVMLNSQSPTDSGRRQASMRIPSL